MCGKWCWMRPRLVLGKGKPHPQHPPRGKSSLQPCHRDASSAIWTGNQGETHVSTVRYHWLKWDAHGNFGWVLLALAKCRHLSPSKLIPLALYQLPILVRQPQWQRESIKLKENCSVRLLQCTPGMEKTFLASDHRGGLQSPRLLSPVLQEYVRKQWRTKPWFAAHLCGEPQTSVNKINYVRLVWLWNPDNIPATAMKTTLTATWFQRVIPLPW